MGLTRAFLAGMGVENEKINAIIEAHAETVDALKAQRDDYKAKADANKTAAEELETAKAAAEKNAGWKEKYEKLSEEHEAYKKEQTSKADKAAKAEKYKKILEAAGISSKRHDAILRVTDLEALELDKDGNFKNADKITESVKTEWSDFVNNEETTGAQTQQPPAGQNNQPNYENMSMAEYIAARSKK